MPIKYPTEAVFKGPWLINEETLKQLDDILDDEWKGLEKRRHSLIEEVADRRVQEYHEQCGNPLDVNERKEILEKFIKNPSYELKQSNRKIILLMNNKGVYETDCFSSALRDNTLHDEIVTGFSINLESGDIRCRMYTTDWDNKLHIEVSPATTNEARGLYSALRGWAVKNSPPKWQQIWANLAGLNWLIWSSLIAISGYILLIFGFNSTANAKDRAINLLDNGITQQNYFEAIELSLILQTKYDPIIQPINNKLPTWYMVLVIGGLVLNLVLSIRSKRPILGIGKGENLISKWKFWYKLIAITIPTLFFTYFLFPYLFELAKGFF